MSATKCKVCGASADMIGVYCNGKLGHDFGPAVEPGSEATTLAGLFFAVASKPESKRTFELARAFQKLIDDRDKLNRHYLDALADCKLRHDRAEAAEADAALAWRRVTELQTRATEVLLDHRKAIAAVRLERDHANAAEAGYAESARYWERRQRTLVRALEDVATAAQSYVPVVDVQARLEALVREFHDHDWDEPDPEAGEAAP